MEPGEANVTPLARSEGTPPDNADARARDVFTRTGIESPEMYVAFVPEASSEWQAGLRAGDRIIDLDGAPQRSWKAMERELLRGANRFHDLIWMRAGDTIGGRFQLRREQWNDEFSQHYERYVFRTIDWVPNAPNTLVPNPSPITYSLRGAFEETASVIQFITVGLVRIVQGRVSISTVSGPITLYDVAGEAGARGAAYFVWAMAVISINLGLVNLLPIPVLDGGHLVFLALEAVKKRPVSLRAREVSSLVGMSVLFLLMLVAFKNDVERRWDVILGQIREIFG
jgi:regulator of sigma E protease